MLQREQYFQYSLYNLKVESDSSTILLLLHIFEDICFVCTLWGMIYAQVFTASSEIAVDTFANL